MVEPYDTGNRARQGSCSHRRSHQAFQAENAMLYQASMLTFSLFPRKRRLLP